MFEEWPELHQEKIELTVDKWVKDLISVTRKKKTVTASPVLRGKALGFFIPQTVMKKAAGRCEHSPRLLSANDSAEPQPSPQTTQMESSLLLNSMEKTGTPLRKDGNIHFETWQLS